MATDNLKLLNKTADDILDMIGEHIKGHDEYTAMTLLAGIEDIYGVGKPWEEVTIQLVKRYINSEAVDILRDKGFEFEFYIYGGSKEPIENKETNDIDDNPSVMALAITWNYAIPVKEIIRMSKLKGGQLT